MISCWRKARVATVEGGDLGDNNLGSEIALTFGYNQLRELNMQIDLDRDVEKVVNEEVQAGRFKSPREFIVTAVKQFLIAREFGEEEARKLATLRAELQRADQQIDSGDSREYDERNIGRLLDDVEAEGMTELAAERRDPK